jgi:hypothetical protein
MLVRGAAKLKKFVTTSDRGREWVGEGDCGEMKSSDGDPLATMVMSY